MRIYALIVIVLSIGSSAFVMPVMRSKMAGLMMGGAVLGYNLLRDSSSEQELRWDWPSIGTLKAHDLAFPPHFIFGVATSEYQVSGRSFSPAAQWAQFEDRTGFFGSPSIVNAHKSGAACEHWLRYHEDIECMKELGVTAYRFSFEWGALEPQEGIFNQQVLQHYHELCDALTAAGITPMVTLHHFTHPQWFEDKGAFEREENLVYFLRFCKKMFQEFGHKIPFWCTINEPGVYAFMGYVLGAFPPAKTLVRWGGAAQFAEVLKNLVRAHTEAYRLIKSMPGGNLVQVGFAHSITQFEPYHPGASLEQLVSNKFTELMYQAILRFFITGVFEFSSWVPSFASVRFVDPAAPFTLDFIGLNYYSHVMFNLLSGGPDYRSGEVPTDMPYGLYAEGIYRAIQQVAPLGVPIYITENGISDARDDRREEFIQKYLYAVSRAVQDGYDVRGYFYWSLLDNFEWHFGYTQKFGLYQVDFDTQKRTLRPGARYFQEQARYHTFVNRNVSISPQAKEIS